MCVFYLTPVLPRIKGQRCSHPSSVEPAVGTQGVVSTSLTMRAHRSSCAACRKRHRMVPVFSRGAAWCTFSSSFAYVCISVCLPSSSSSSFSPPELLQPFMRSLQHFQLHTPSPHSLCSCFSFTIYYECSCMRLIIIKKQNKNSQQKGASSISSSDRFLVLNTY